jgi:phospholipid:diacylglycerol acyltransferase
VEKYIESNANIAGPLLGVPKAVSALLSGEMKDTSMLLGPVGEIAEQYFGRKMRKDMFATWGALWAMLPKGGDVVWNTVPDGQESLPMLTLTDPSTDITDDELKNISENKVVRKKLMEFASKQNHTASDLVDFLLTWGSGYGPDLSAAKFHKFEKQSDEPITKEHWHDVTVTPLPDAPSTKIYCLYGVGAETEVGYFYKTSWNGYEGDESKCADNRCDPPFLLNTTVKDAERKNNIQNHTHHVTLINSFSLVLSRNRSVVLRVAILCSGLYLHGLALLSSITEHWRRVQAKLRRVTLNKKLKNIPSSRLATPKSAVQTFLY